MTNHTTHHTPRREGSVMSASRTTKRALVAAATLVGLSAGVMAAVHADPLGVLVAFGAGMLSFLSPCVLPLVPAYVGMLAGATVSGGRASPARTMLPGSTRRRPICPASGAVMRV